MIKLFEEYTKFRKTNKSVKVEDALILYSKIKALPILNDFKNKWIMISCLDDYLLYAVDYGIIDNDIHVIYDKYINYKVDKLIIKTRTTINYRIFHKNAIITIMDDFEVEDKYVEQDPYNEEIWDDDIIENIKYR